MSRSILHLVLWLETCNPRQEAQGRRMRSWSEWPCVWGGVSRAGHSRCGISVCSSSCVGLPEGQSQRAACAGKWDSAEQCRAGRTHSALEHWWNCDGWKGRSQGPGSFLSHRGILCMGYRIHQGCRHPSSFSFILSSCREELFLHGVESLVLPCTSTVELKLNLHPKTKPPLWALGHHSVSPHSL